jgi:hypothetical protein
VSGLVWLASYPKSGNTWLRILLESLARGGAPVDINWEQEGRPGSVAPRAEFDNRLGVDSSDLLADEIEAARPRLYEAMAADAHAPVPLKVHDAWTHTTAGEPLFPPRVTAGAVYIVRDPRDVAVSLAHHIGRDVDHAIAMMADPGARFGQAGDHRYNLQLRQRLRSWSGHVTSWLDAPIRLHLLRYEDMIAAPAAAFGDVARFLGHAVDADSLARAIAATRFDALRAQEERDGFIERGPRAHRFFRRGTAGGWHDTLTPAQAHRIAQDHGAAMARLGYR